MATLKVNGVRDRISEPSELGRGLPSGKVVVKDAARVQTARAGGPEVLLEGLAPDDIVESRAAVPEGGRPPLVVLDTLLPFLDEHGLGSGELGARRIGEGGGSNFTFLLEREDGLFVLRRPPRPPLPPPRATKK